MRALLAGTVMAAIGLTLAAVAMWPEREPVSADDHTYRNYAAGIAKSSGLAGTATPTNTATATATATTVATATATPTPDPDNDPYADNYTWFRPASPQNAIYIYSEVVNPAPYPIEIKDVTVELYTSQGGGFIGTYPVDFDSVDLLILPTIAGNATAPIGFYVLGVPDGMLFPVPQFEFITNPFFPDSFFTDLVITDLQTLVNGTTLEASAQIQNVSGEPYVGVGGVIGLYNPAGDLVWGKAGPAETTSLPPGLFVQLEIEFANGATYADYAPKGWAFGAPEDFFPP